MVHESLKLCDHEDHKNDPAGSKPSFASWGEPGKDATRCRSHKVKTHNLFFSALSFMLQ
jgi:hypothetical protein